MPAEKTNKAGYKTLNASNKNGGAKSHDQNPLTPSSHQKKENLPNKNLNNPYKESEKKIPSGSILEKTESTRTEFHVSQASDTQPETETNYIEQAKSKKRKKKVEKDLELLGGEKWLKRNGHNFTYAGLYLFSILVFFRPYELIPALSFLSTAAFIFAVATLAVYIPTQLSTEGSLTVLPTEVKCILVMTLIALVTMPIAKDPPTAWATFNETFIKAVLMFIVMVNVVRTRRRLMGLMWLSLSVGLYLSYTAINLYLSGEVKIEGYRVGVEVKGLFGNPNDLALHLVTITPIALALAFGSRNKLMRLVYYSMTGLFIAANTVTFSRGGFLGLLAASGVLIWKLARKNRLNISIASIAVGGLFILLAPGNYGMRILSIFVPELDPVGSSDQRRELLIRSLIVTARNPWGIGIGNFPIVGIRNLVTHNSFTQISSELGLLGLAAYLIFMISPFRKLGAIERTLFAKEDLDWFYYLAIGLQASIVGYMVSSFFVSVAYNWFVYYLIAYAVAFRRIYKVEKGIEESEKDVFGLQTV
jgi:putative inorganic carbon (hco3(-)) transporter